MADESPAAEARLLELLHRLRHLGLERCPCRNGKMTTCQFALLDRIAGSPGSGIRETASAMGLTPPTVSVGVRRMEESGLLQRQPDPQDGRAIQLFPTPHGHELHQRARAFRRHKARQLLAGLTVEHQETLLRLLERAISAAEASALYQSSGEDDP